MAGEDWIFYDGDCGLCHRFVRFAIARDRDLVFRFAPIGGGVFRRLAGNHAPTDLPDSVIVLTAEGRLLVRSRGTLHCLRRLGGAWKALAVVADLVPLSVADFVYDRIAAVRHRLFRRPTEICPLPSADARARFDLEP